MLSSPSVTSRTALASLGFALIVASAVFLGTGVRGDDRIVLGPAAQRTAVGPLFALEPIAARLGIRVEKSLDSYTLSVGDLRLIAGAGNPVALIGRDIVQLSQAPTEGTAADGSPALLVPLDLFQKSLGDALAFDFQFTEEEGLVAARRTLRKVPVTVDVVHLQGVTTVVLQFPERVELRPVATPDGVDVTAVRDRFEPAGVPFTGDDPWVRDVRVTPDRIRLLLASGAKAESYPLENPYRLVFDVVAASGARPDGGAPLAGPLPGAPARPTRAFDTIVLDPGHGGSETGAIGPGGNKEKDITLQIAETLAARLREAMPVKVVLTRSSDLRVPLDARPALANQNKADLFVSIHLNSWFDPQAHGAETYFLSLEASDRRADAAAETENRSPEDVGDGEGDPLADLELILWDLAQSRHLHSSEKVAKIVQGELNQALGLTDRGVKQAPFRVLMGAAMPAILVELGYISNPDEEAKLRDPGYREQLAAALVRAISRYADESRPAEPMDPSAAPAVPTPAAPTPAGETPP